MTPPDEPCDSATEFTLGSWLVCEATGPHRYCWGHEPNGRTHRWPNPNAKQEVET